MIDDWTGRARDPARGTTPPAAVWTQVPKPTVEPARTFRGYLDRVGDEKAWPLPLLMEYQAAVLQCTAPGPVGAGQLLRAARARVSAALPGSEGLAAVAESMAHAQSAQQSGAYEAGGLVLPGIGDVSRPEGARRLHMAVAVGVGVLGLAGAAYTAPVWVPLLRRLL